MYRDTVVLISQQWYLEGKKKVLGSADVNLLLFFKGSKVFRIYICVTEALCAYSRFSVGVYYVKVEPLVLAFP